MSAVTPPTIPTTRARSRRSVRGHDLTLIISAAVIAILVAMAVFAPLLAPHDPNQTNILAANQGPGGGYLLGTDAVGRDIFSRIIYGARLSLLGPAIVVGLATIFGAASAIISAWFGGGIDSAVSRVLDILFAFPGLIFAILAVAIFGTGLTAPVIALSFAYLPYIARVVRSVAVRERRLPYVDALYVGGLSGVRISLRHLLPNILPFIVVQAALSFGAVLVDLSALSYLGLGVQPPASEWGLMVADGQQSILNGHAMESIAAGIMIVITVVAFNLLGDRLAHRTQETR